MTGIELRLRRIERAVSPERRFAIVRGDALFQVHPAPEGPRLIGTDPRFDPEADKNILIVKAMSRDMAAPWLVDQLISAI